MKANSKGVTLLEVSCPLMSGLTDKLSPLASAPQFLIRTTDTTSLILQPRPQVVAPPKEMSLPVNLFSLRERASRLMRGYQLRA